jgi:hypothetical protein
MMRIINRRFVHAGVHVNSVSDLVQAARTEPAQLFRADHLGVTISRASAPTDDGIAIESTESKKQRI